MLQLLPHLSSAFRLVQDQAGKFEFLWNNRDRLKQVKRFIIAADGDGPAGAWLPNWCSGSRLPSAWGTELGAKLDRSTGRRRRLACRARGRVVEKNSCARSFAERNEDGDLVPKPPRRR